VLGNGIVIVIVIVIVIGIVMVIVIERPAERCDFGHPSPGIGTGD